MLKPGHNHQVPGLHLFQGQVAACIAALGVSCQDLYAKQYMLVSICIEKPMSCLSLVVQESLLQIVAASSFAIVAAALECHVNEATRRGWALPTQLHKGTAAGLPASACMPATDRQAVSLSACLPASAGVCLSACLRLHVSVCSSVCLSV